MYVCAWCDRKLDRPAGQLYGQPAVKHGLCATCLEAELRRLAPAEPPAPQAEPAPRPAFAAA